MPLAITPEAHAREQIDAHLVAAGWTIQNNRELNLGAARGIDIREVPPKSGRCNYLLLVDRVPLGVAESVHARFNSWLRQKDAAVAAQTRSPLERGGAQRRGVSPTVEKLPPTTAVPGSRAFSPGQLAWLHLIRDHIATSVTVEPDDFEFAPFF